jgi:cytochrome c oxidase assembly protein subunit 17
MLEQNACPIQASSKAKQTSEDLKPCCACPDTRKLRDDCVFLNGEDSCTEFIEKHKECLRSFGFKID